MPQRQPQIPARQEHPAPGRAPRAVFLVAALASLLAAQPARAIVGGTATSAFAHVGDGVQFTDNWVLTARHLGTVVGSTYSNGWGQAAVAARYDLGSGDFPASDLSLLRLATPISAAPTLGLLGTLLPVGVLATPVAATITTNSTQAPRGYAPTSLNRVVDQFGTEGAGQPAPVVVNWLLSLHGTNQQLPYVQGGDSGGGLFLGAVADSTGALLMGINSALLQDGPNALIGSAFVQLAAERSWIDSTMANDLADSQVARWVFAPVPEPASWALLLAGGAALAVRRRRSAAHTAGQGTSLP